MAKHLDHGGKWIRKEKRWAIYTRDHFRCVYCDRALEHGQDGGELSLDHLDEDGGNHETNLITACRKCNTAKGGSSVATFASKLAKERIAAAILKPIYVAKAREDLRNRNVGIAARIKGEAFPKIFASPQSMAALAKTTASRLYELSRAGRIPEATPEGYDVIATLCGMVAVVKDESAAEASKDKARMTRAEADNAEIDREERLGRLVSAEDMRLRWLDRIIEVRRLVETAEYLKPAQKTQLLSALAKVKEPTEEEAE